jgi:hypothetical protein
LFGGEMGTLDDASFSEQCLMATRARSQLLPKDELNKANSFTLIFLKHELWILSNDAQPGFDKRKPQASWPGTNWI